MLLQPITIAAFELDIVSGDDQIVNARASFQSRDGQVALQRRAAEQNARQKSRSDAHARERPSSRVGGGRAASRGDVLLLQSALRGIAPFLCSLVSCVCASQLSETHCHC